jgi:hypothetical protein
LSAFGGLILMLGVFTFGSSGFTVSENNNFGGYDCDLVAAQAWQQAADDGLRGDRLNEVYSDAFFDCEDYWYHGTTNHWIHPVLGY